MINGLLAPGSCLLVRAVGARAAAVTPSSECDSDAPLVKKQLMEAASRLRENRRELL